MHTWFDAQFDQKILDGIYYRQWIYQTCTEFGWYQSSDQPGHPYGTKFPVDFSVKVKPKIKIFYSQNYAIKWLLDEFR